MIRPDLLLLAAVLLPLSPAWSDSGHDAVANLGAVNGVALACRYPDEVSRMKAAVVANAPKERSYGLAFDESTNAAFLDFIEKREPCPAKAVFSGRVDAAIEELVAAFAAP
jgi:hypothetical protein